MRRLTTTGRVILASLTVLLCLGCLRLIRELPQDDAQPIYVVMPIADPDHVPSCPEGYHDPEYFYNDTVRCIRADIKGE